MVAGPLPRPDGSENLTPLLVLHGSGVEWSGPGEARPVVRQFTRGADSTPGMRSNSCGQPQSSHQRWDGRYFARAGICKGCDWIGHTPRSAQNHVGEHEDRPAKLSQGPWNAHLLKLRMEIAQERLDSLLTCYPPDQPFVGRQLTNSL
jgi:hypothetical protein